jgi:rhamnogalacturonyl hydrolase YesR
MTYYKAAFPILSGLLIFCQNPVMSAQSPEEIVEKVASHWLDLHNHFETPKDAWGDYTIDLTLEALLKYDALTRQKDFVRLAEKVMELRQIRPADTIPYRSQPFCSINFTLGEVTGDRDWYTGFKAGSEAMYHEARFSPEGAVLLHHREGYYLIIDYLQEYASRLVRTGFLTHDSICFEEGVRQFEIYERLLRNDSTGLWSQGRGWLIDSLALSPGSWSRGHGWLLRGIITSMIYLPDNYRQRLGPVLQRVVNALAGVQDENGMWHILLSEPLEASEPDVSGTGMIDYYLALAVSHGWLDKSVYAQLVLKSTASLKTYVGQDGEVYNSCMGPGPVRSVEEYRHYHPEPDERHGFQGMIYGMMAGMILNELTE